MLIILGGLPGSGKTTVARALARRLGAVHVRVDTIEQAIRASGDPSIDIGPAGYVVAYGVAEDNLTLGSVVIADSVNPLEITRDAWLAVAARSGVTAVEIEVICSDKTSIATGSRRGKPTSKVLSNRRGSKSSTEYTTTGGIGPSQSIRLRRIRRRSSTR
jgi:predicted kinase